ncbi:helix-turn-helix transcriptional regulator [Ectobacillus sp. sgz5001026]|uniref:helix-turn-helix transcriptional regulator n=1 Tax=Ectobacillus sp. sgz5001026 TaxID=3242473 RepID=UPI0036D3DADA
MGEQEIKSLRILSLYERLRKGEMISKKEEAVRFEVNLKTIQRDLDELRLYLATTYKDSIALTYNRSKKSYSLNRSDDIGLTKEEILALTKVLLETRAFSDKEMKVLLDKLIIQSRPDDRTFIKEVIGNERIHYEPPHHDKPLLSMIWDLGEAVRTKRLIEISYEKEEGTKSSTRMVQPVGLLFSEYYFYLAAFLVDYDFKFPTIYRVDRISNYEIKKEHFKVNYKDRFEEGQFRKRIQFMNPGALLKVTFRFWGTSLQAVLDRLPTARIVSQDENGAIIEAEVFGNGVKMWLLSQGPYIEVLKPTEFRNEMKETLEKMLENHSHKEEIMD